MSNEVQSSATPEQRQEAADMGWIPPERYRGDPDKFVDADVFVKRGKELLPIVRASEAKLRGEVGSLKSQNGALAGSVEELKGQLKDVLEFQSEFVAARLKEQRRAILAKVREAKEAGNDDLVADLEEELEETREAIAEAKEKKTSPAATPTASPPPAPAIPPELVAWKAANPWFGVDERKTRYAHLAGADAAAKGLKGTAFYDFIDAEIAATFAPSRGPGKADEGHPTGGGRGGGGSGNGSGQSYADLPADAKAACDADERRFVGDKKLYKTAADWRANYAKLYFSSTR